jgi:hypothetical protein
VAICGRVRDGRAWYENVYPTEKFSFLMNPWVAERPDSVEKPGFDVTRFNLPHWHKIERTLRHAREKDMIISIIFYVDGPGRASIRSARPAWAARTSSGTTATRSPAWRRSPT